MDEPWQETRDVPRPLGLLHFPGRTEEGMAEALAHLGDDSGGDVGRLPAGVTRQGDAQSDQRQRDNAPAQCYLLFEQPRAHAGGCPCTPSQPAEERIRDRRHEIAPPLGAIQEQVRAREREAPGTDERIMRRVPQDA